MRLSDLPLVRPRQKILGQHGLAIVRQLLNVCNLCAVPTVNLADFVARGFTSILNEVWSRASVTTPTG
ncbi:MAG TPA: hypothetical protein VN901_05380 [Candidatus Acidoferrales bacterium]|nr:hypothetical protein [Candidatus Acidoferrales bacterium]